MNIASLKQIEISSAARAEIAPSGVCRAAINLDNAVLVQRDAHSGALSGVAVDLATAFAQMLDVPLELEGFESAAKIVLEADASRWDISFFATDPERALKVWYSPAYVVIEGSYMVRADSTFLSNADVDQTGVKVAVGVGAAYDLYLTRHLVKAELVRLRDSPAAIEAFVAGQSDVVAGVRQPLLRYAGEQPGYRVLAGHFTTIQQAMVAPRGRPLAAEVMTRFIEAMKASGAVEQALRRARQSGASVAPPAPLKP